MEKAKHLGSVNDGAAWIWNIVRMCYDNCVEIIDWRHAVEKLWLIAQHRFDVKSEQATAWVSAAPTSHQLMPKRAPQTDNKIKATTKIPASFNALPKWPCLFYSTASDSTPSSSDR